MRQTIKLMVGAAFIAVTSIPVSAETIEIGIGHQSTVTNTVPGGIILQKLKILEKYLPKDGKYKDAKYKIIYKDYTSGPPITNQMLAGKLAFGVMGDYPLIVNGAKFQETGKKTSKFIAVTGYNLKGTGNGIVVPVASDIYSLAQLEGKTISSPFGSAAWGMTLKALRDAKLLDKVNLRNQSPPVGVAKIANGKIDAHSDFCPWSEVMEFRGTGRKIFDGSEADIPTFHGTVVNNDFATKYPEIVHAYLEATLEAQAWIIKDPANAATKVSEWTGIEKEVLYLYFSKGGISTFEASIKPVWAKALKYDHELLVKEKNIPPLDFNAWIDHTYVEAAFKKRGLDYKVALKEVVSPVIDDPKLAPAEMWIKGEGIVAYKSVKEMIEAYKAAVKDKKTVFSTYVYDKATGLKLFGKVAFLVSDAKAVTAFMKKGDADKFLKKTGGKLIAWKDATS